MSAQKGVNAAAWFYGQPGFHAPSPATTPALDAPLTPAVPVPGEGNLLRTVPPVPTPDSVLARAKADLAEWVVDLLDSEAGYDDAATALTGIIATARKALDELSELDEQASQSRSESEVAW